MKILVYNNDTNKIETFFKNLNDPMPYIQGNNLTVDEFKGSSKSNILWTDKRLMESFNKLREIYGKPIPVRYAFKRIREGGHSNMSQHYAGMAMDMAQALDNTERKKIRKIAIDNKLFTYVEPGYLTPTWVHVDKRNPIPACPTGGYPKIKLNDKSVYTIVLQDALNFLEYEIGEIDGIFGNKTNNSVINFQKDNNLIQDGIVGCNTWRTLTKKVADKRKK